MLPCQKECLLYQPGCHKTCARWKVYQDKMTRERKKQMDFLRQKDDVCKVIIRQCRAISLGSCG